MVSSCACGRRCPSIRRRRRQPGKVLGTSAAGIDVGTGNGVLRLTRVQSAGPQSDVRCGVPQRASSGRRGTRIVSRSAAVRADAAKIVADVAMRGRSLDAALTIDAASYAPGARPAPCARVRQHSLVLAARCVARAPAGASRSEARARRARARDRRAVPAAVHGDSRARGRSRNGRGRAPPRARARSRLHQCDPAPLPARARATRRADRSRCRRAHRASALAGRCARRRTGASRPRRFSLRTISVRRSGSASIAAARLAAQYRARLAASGIAVADSMYDDEALLLDGRRRRRGSAGIRRRRGVDPGRRRAARRAICSRREPGERILDACAAPGGKTGHLLELQPELARAGGGRCFFRAPDANRRQPAPTGIVGDAGGRRCRRTGRLVGRAALRADPARRAVLGDGRHPASSGHQAAAPAGRHRGARGQAIAAAARVVGVACAGRAAGLRELLGAAGRNRGGRRGIQGDRRHRRARRLPPCGSRLGQPAWTAFIMLA